MNRSVGLRPIGRRVVFLSVILCAALIGALVAGFFVQRASSQQASGTIRACVSLYTGQLRVVRVTGTCSSTEYPIEWNQEGTQGEQGPPGPAGPVGPTGPSGLSGYEIVSDVFDVPTGGGTLMQVDCPAGNQVLGGGYNTDSFQIASTQQGLEVKISQPSAGGRDPGWAVAMTNTTGESKSVTVYAICAAVTS